MIEKGMWIKCNDPRYGWTVPILEVKLSPNLPGYAVIRPRPNGRVVKVRLGRIFEDNKPRKQGYNLVPAPTDKVAQATILTNILA